MSETDNKPTLGRKPLGIKRSVEAGEVKQTFSHGRTNKVVVEGKRRKLIGKPGEAPAAPAPAALAGPSRAPTPAPGPAPGPGPPGLKRNPPGNAVAPAARGRRVADERARSRQSPRARRSPARLR